jgi:hypothetical protein
MRLLIAFLCLFAAVTGHAAGISSKTADHVLYKTMAGTTTIKVPDWELVVDSDSLAGKKNLPVPKSNKTFDVTLPLPRNKLLSILSKLAKLNPYLFIAQGLIDLYFDETKNEFMTGNSTGYLSSCSGTEFESILQQRFPGATIRRVYTYGDKSSVMINHYKPNDSKSYSAKATISQPSTDNFVVTVEGVSFPYATSDYSFNSLRNVNIFALPREGTIYYICGAPSYLEPEPQLSPATETDIANNLNKNITANKLPVVRDLVLSQNWTLETDNVPVVTGPDEIIVSTKTKTIQNPDGTTTTQQIVEKLVYTYSGNTIIENHVTQVFEGDQIVETNITEVNNETSNEPVDYTFQPPDGQYPTDLEIPEKRDLVAEVLNPVASQLEDFGGKIGLRGSGQCAFDIPFNLGVTSGTGRLDFCQYQSTFSTLGSMLVAFAYLMAGLIVIGMRH